MAKAFWFKSFSLPSFAAPKLLWTSGGRNFIYNKNKQN
jgi:hypothetical protein